LLEELRRHAAVSADLRKIAGLKFRSPVKGGNTLLKRVAPKAYSLEGPHKLRGPKMPKLKMSGVAGAVLKGSSKAALKAGKHLGSAILNHPEKALLLGAAAIAGVGKARGAMAGFNPAIHRAKLGIEP
jgi:hypothetical protein